MLTLLSSIYSVVVRCRATLYRLGVLPSQRLPAPVISVGNLTAGGTGKTPLVGFLCLRLEQAGYQPAILSRGYKGSAEKTACLVSDGVKVGCTPRESGDEAFELASRLSSVPVAVGANRLRSGALVPASDRRVFLLDDGYQHLRIHRDLNLLTIDATAPLGAGRLLPAGLLREPPAAAERANWIIITRAHQVDDLTGLRSELRSFNQKAPILEFRNRPTDLVDLASGRLEPLDLLRNAPVGVLAAIGNPRQFIADVSSMEMRVEREFLFPDHHWFSREEIEKVIASKRQNELHAIVTTEKDAVRLRELDLDFGGFYSLRILAEPIDFGRFESEFQRWLDTLDDKPRANLTARELL